MFELLLYKFNVNSWFKVISKMILKILNKIGYLEIIFKFI
jgi:hypothetical protein